MYTLRTVTAPTAEPLSLADARDHCHVDSFDHDGMLSAYILAARSHVENICGMALCTQTLGMTMDEFPAFGEIVLPRYPVQSVTSVQYLDTAGVLTTWATSEWQSDLNGPSPRIAPKSGKSWPTIGDAFASVQIQFIAGFGAPHDVPPLILQAIRLLVGHWFENREATSSGSLPREIELGVNAMLAQYRSPI